MSGTSGKIVLLNTNTAFTGTTPEGTIDYVGYGLASVYEGIAPTKSLSNATSAQRRPYANVDPAPEKGNAWDTNDNATDFYVGSVTAPRNSCIEWKNQ